MSSSLRRPRKLLEQARQRVSKLAVAQRARASKVFEQQVKRRATAFEDRARSILKANIPFLKERWAQTKDPKRLLEGQWRILNKILPLKGASIGNRVQIFANGSDAFSNMWQAIASAKKRVWMETFILEPDAVGLRTIQELARAAARGVEVIFLYDHVGSLDMRDYHFAELRNGGGVAMPFHYIFTPYLGWRAHPLHRNHRKVLVVDDEVAFCGGMNISSDYAGVEVGGTGRFRDTHAKIEGPAVLHLAGVFLNSLRRAAHIGDWQNIKERFAHSRPQLSPSKMPPFFEGGSTVQVLRNDADLRYIQKALAAKVRSAQETVFLTTPYFLPPKKLRTAIVKAAKRGVDVRILTAGKCDIKSITWAATHCYGFFLRKGVRIFEMRNRELHAKTATVDGTFASVGSYNLDYLSYYHQLEANLTIVDPRQAKQLEDQFFKDLEVSAEVKLDEWENRPWYLRAFHWLAYHVARFVLSVGATLYRTSKK